jgi:hypothetical protein
MVFEEAVGFYPLTVPALKHSLRLDIVHQVRSASSVRNAAPVRFTRSLPSAVLVVTIQQC